MAFVAITNAEIAAGEPTKQELFDKIQDNFDDHESRIAVNAANSSNIPPIIFYFNEPMDDVPEQDEVLSFRVPFDVQWLGARLLVIKDGTAGTVDVDIRSAVGAGAYSTILTGNITKLFGSGDRTTTSGTILGSNNTSSAGDWVTIDVDATMTGGSFAVQLEYESN